MGSLEITVGTQMPEWSRTTDLEHFNRYAAVNDEFVDIHMSDVAGIRAGSPHGAFGMGNLRYAYLVNALRDWLGDRFELRSLECQFRALNLKGDTLTVTGIVREVHLDGPRTTLHIEMGVLNQSGVNTCPAFAVAQVTA